MNYYHSAEVAFQWMIADFLSGDRWDEEKGHPKTTYVESVPAVAPTVVLPICTGCSRAGTDVVAHRSINNQQRALAGACVRQSSVKT